MLALRNRSYRIDWHGEREAVLPFLQVDDWDLPTVEIEIDGETVHAWIDTGGDALTLPHEYDIEPLGRFSGTFAGVYGRVEEVRLGPVTVTAVPVMTSGLERPVIGTGFLSRFLPRSTTRAAAWCCGPGTASPATASACRSGSPPRT
jgi:hypothetical protein